MKEFQQSNNINQYSNEKLKENQNFELEKYVKSNFAEIFEKINELNKMATHLVKQNEKISVIIYFIFISLNRGTEYS